MKVSEACEFYSGLKPLCVARLREALNPATGLYDRQLCKGLWHTTLENENMYSTAICLIALSRSDLSLNGSSLGPPEILKALVEVVYRRRFYRVLGLMIWANAVWDGMPLIDLLHRFKISLNELTGIMLSMITSEVAWFVSGLSHELSRLPQKRMAKTLRDAVDILLERYNRKTSLFYHTSADASFPNRIRMHIGTFADQIYSIQALSLAAIGGSSDYGMAAADKCAKRIVSQQGDLGQWWWHYAVQKGCTAQAYPVYSVHQHGMAPMGLMTLASAGGTEFPDALSLSRAWLSHNELGVNMIDREHGTIWRDIEYEEEQVENMIEREHGTIWRDIEYEEGFLGWLVRHIRSVVGWNLGRNNSNPTKLKVNYETWPYEWAWCLCAGSLTDSTDKGSHLV